MKSRIFYACLIMMLLISTVVFGVIETGSSGCGNHAYANASAGSSNNYEEDSESGSYWEYTTTSGTFDWNYALEAEANVSAFLEYGKWASATAVADADVSGAGSGSLCASASVSGTGSKLGGEYLYKNEEPPDEYDDGTTYLSAYSGISSDNVALAVAQVEEGSDCSATAYAYASACGCLYEN